MFALDELIVSINSNVFAPRGYRYLRPDRSVLATTEARGQAAKMTATDGWVLATLHQHSDWRPGAPVTIAITGGPSATLVAAKGWTNSTELWLEETMLARIDRGPRRRTFVALAQTGVDVAQLQLRHGEMHLWRRPGLGEPGRSLLTLLPWALLVIHDDFVPGPRFS